MVAKAPWARNVVSVIALDASHEVNLPALVEGLLFHQCGTCEAAQPRLLLHAQRRQRLEGTRHPVNCPQADGEAVGGIRKQNARRGGTR